jgi:hypothetical protein
LDLRIKSYGSLKFLREVWAGRAYAGANEEELIKYKTFLEKEGGGKGVGGYQNGRPVGARSAAANGWSALSQVTSGHPATRRPRPTASGD